MLYNPPYGSGDPNAAYVNGNPATGTAGSVPPAAQMEHPQREIVAVIAAAGLTPSSGDLTQLLQAIQKLGGKTKPLYGLHALPATTMTVPNDVNTDITAYGTVTNGLQASTFSSGILTIGTGDDGFYLLTDWLGTNLATGAYGWSQSIGVSTDGGSVYTAIGGIATITSAGSVFGPFAGVSVVRKLDVGDKVKLALKQNSGSSQNAPCGFSAIFMGK